MKPLSRSEGIELSELEWSRWYCKNSRRRTRKFCKKRMNRLRRRIDEL
jgi:hypothetical protein